MRKQRYSSCAGVAAVSLALVLGSTSCSDDADKPSAPAADGGAPEAGAGGAPDAGTGAGGVAGGTDGGAGGDSTPQPLRVRVSGSAQKGPIVAGSSVTVFGLDATLEPTGTSFPSQTEDNLGTFDVSANLTEELIEVVAQGPFYDELTGHLSETSIVLRALAAAEPDTDIRVNLLTTASKNRIRYLVAQGQEFDAAVARAEQEVLGVFGIEDDSLAAFTTMDITGGSASDAALIALSAILLQYADDHSDSEGQKVAALSLAVSTLASDLEEDGVLDDEGLNAGIPRAAVRLDVAAVTTNLEEIYSGLGQSVLVPNIQPFVDIVAAPAPWQFAPSLPVARSGHCACAAGGKIYVMGGAAGYGLDDVFQYDPATKEWTPKAKMLMARAYPACSVVDGVIYVSGGLVSGDYSDAVEAYDPAQDAWTLKHPMPEGRGAHVSTAVDGKIYVLSGTRGKPSDSVDVYDPMQDAWEAVAPLPTLLLGQTSAAVGGKLYTFGGYDGTHISSATYEYNPNANTWTPRASMPTARQDATAVPLGEKVYVIGGTDRTSALPIVEEYDQTTNTWTTKAPPNVARTYATGVPLGALAYVIGGSTIVANNVSRLALVETYDPSKDP